VGWNWTSVSVVAVVAVVVVPDRLPGVSSAKVMAKRPQFIEEYAVIYGDFSN